MSTTTFRQSLMTTLETALSIPFVPGKLEGNPGRGDIGCVFPGGFSEVEDDVSLQQTTMFARVFKKPDARRREPQKPIDPTELETLADAIPAALDDVQTSAGPWYFRVVSVEIDMDTLGIEAVITGWEANTFRTTS